MITIKILNANKLVEQEKGRLISKIAPFFMNIETAVEKRIAEQIKQSFQERQIEAIIEIVSEN